MMASDRGLDGAADAVGVAGPDDDAPAPAAELNRHDDHEAAHPSRRVRPEFALVAGTTAIIATLVAWGTSPTGGFSYTLDDPMIHLRVAQQIAQGHYGLNPGEAASPSSSALWPFLMAAFSWTGRLLWVPLIATTIATLVSVRLLYAIVRTGWHQLDRTGWVSAAVTGLLVITTNLTGVALTGMEHSLHIALSLAVLLGLARASVGERPRPWMWGVLVVLPLVRYEGLVIAMVAAALLWWFGHRRPAARSAAAAVAGVAAFSAFLASLGLSAVPSSVLVKASTTDGAHGIGRIVEQATHNWSWAVSHQDPSLYALALCAVLLAICCQAAWSGRATAQPGTDRPEPHQPGSLDVRRELTLLGFASAILVVHITVFAVDTFGRYALYATILGFTAAIACLPTALALAARHAQRPTPALVGFAVIAATPVAVLLLGGSAGLAMGVVATLVVVAFVAMAAARHTRLDLLAVTALVLFTAGAPLIARTTSVPGDMQAIYDQQFQMHRIAQQLGQPVAVNDIGWVAFDNDEYVLDLWGLASQDARVARQAGTPGWADELMARHQVDIAMVYRGWFTDQIPASWITVAELKTSPVGPLGGDTVTIFARTPTAASEAVEALRWIETDLPPGDRLTFA